MRPERTQASWCSKISTMIQTSLRSAMVKMLSGWSYERTLPHIVFDQHPALGRHDGNDRAGLHAAVRCS